MTEHPVRVRPVRRSDSEDELLGSLTVAVHANGCSVDCRKVKDEVLKWLCFSSALFFLVCLSEDSVLPCIGRGVPPGTRLADVASGLSDQRW